MATPDPCGERRLAITGWCTRAGTRTDEGGFGASCDIAGAGAGRDANGGEASTGDSAESRRQTCETAAVE